MRHLNKITVLVWLILGGQQYIIAQNTGWTLKECIDSTIANNLNLRQSVYTIELNRINYKQSKNNLLPNISGNAGEVLGAGRMVNPVTDLYETGTVWATSVGLSFSQNLFDGLQYLLP